MTPRRQPTSARWFALLAGLIAIAGCGDDDGASSAGTPSVTPRQFGHATLRPAAEAGSGDLANAHLSPGRNFEVLQYEVPEYPCVRTDSSDYLHIPEVTSVPGAPAIFYAVPPKILRSQC